jgi:polar amino acid transport system permease protein
MFSFEFLIRILPDLMRGLVVTVQATFGGFALALVIGLLLALGRRSGVKPLRLFCDGYIASCVARRCWFSSISSST